MASTAVSVRPGVVGPLRRESGVDALEDGHAGPVDRQEEALVSTLRMMPRRGGQEAMRQCLRGGRASAVPLDDAVAEREADEAGDVEDLQPLHHLAAMGLDRLDAQLEHEGDFLDRPPFDDELQDLALPRAERVDGAPDRRVGRGHPGQEAADHHPGHGAADVDLAAQHGPQRQRQLGDGGVLQQVAGGAGPQRLQHVGIGAVHREDDRARPGMVARDQRRRLEPVEPRHGDVHQHDRRVVRGNRVERLAPVAGLEHRRDLRQAFEQRAEPGPHERVIVGEQDGVAHDATAGSGPADAGAEAASGMRRQTVVPRPGAESTSRLPPANAARSRMLTRPRCWPGVAPAACPGSKPQPSSISQTASSPPSLRAASDSRLAPEWRRTLASASWTTR